MQISINFDIWKVVIKKRACLDSFGRYFYSSMGSSIGADDGLGSIGIVMGPEKALMLNPSTKTRVSNTAEILFFINNNSF